ncbi:MAG TPA: alpha/beta fold hydrolase [Stellaceae bacterium]|jgi:polyhydroxyalkanoate synthase|nr:alpha/beta fold hydrolase [Stellaceae bacterium]
MTNGKDKAPETGGAEDVAAQATEGILGPNPFIGLRPQDILATVGNIGGQAVKQPMLVLEQEAALARELISVLSGTAEIAPSRGDKRFLDIAWKDNPFYRMSLQGYLAWGSSLSSFVEKSGLDNLTKQRAQFVVSLLTDALAPTNTLLGNPAALKRVIDSGGASLLEGFKNLLADLTANRGMPAQVDTTAFQLGKNLALSPGAVVFRNDVLELIQYAPATGEVYARPQMIVPPQINKYYVFDLSPGRSIVEYLVQNGFQVFVVSWRNPTPAQSDWDMSTYVAALLESIAAVRDITGAEDVNLDGACSGAMTVAALLGHLAAKRQKLVHAATLMVAVFAANAESLLGLFATPEIIAAAKRNSRLKGVLDGQEMGRVFAWMRPNDLVWNYWVNNYLMGNPPPAFDILYWNNDATRLAAKFHGQLIDIFVDSQFQKPGVFEILGTPIDLSEVDCDKYVVAGITDHITPWKGVFSTARTFGGETDFVLTSSGHIQSLVNPPGNPKARFSLNPDLPESAEDWLAAAREVSGSWWDHWREWLAAHSGEMRAAPQSLGNERYKPGAKAPGTYVIEP